MKKIGGKDHFYFEDRLRNNTTLKGQIPADLFTNFIKILKQTKQQ